MRIKKIKYSSITLTIGCLYSQGIIGRIAITSFGLQTTRHCTNGIIQLRTGHSLFVIVITKGYDKRYVSFRHAFQYHPHPIIGWLCINHVACQYNQIRTLIFEYFINTF